MVDTEQKLAGYLPVLAAASWVALDTEADSLHAYPEKVCLIQISTVSGDRLIDPLAGINLDPLLDALADHELIMHGADYDLRLLRKHHAFVPRAIFDTMLAARLLGCRQFGLSYLVEQRLGIRLEKGQQKANWALRPLTPRMERYARNDTHYLKPLADQLKDQLVAAGRLAWHQEACTRLIADAAKERPTDRDSVWRLKGSHLLGRPALAILRELWQWRENEALAANRPPFFVLSHQTLVDVAAAAAAARPYERLLPRHLSERRRRALRQAVTRGLLLPPEQRPGPVHCSGRRPHRDERGRFLLLQQRRDAAAAKLGLDPTVIASRATLSALAHDWPQYQADLMPWQRELLAGDGPGPRMSGG